MFHTHTWVQVKDVFYNKKDDATKKGIFLFCESCHAVCAINLYGNIPEYTYVNNKNKTKGDEK